MTLHDFLGSEYQHVDSPKLVVLKIWIYNVTLPNYLEKKYIVTFNPLTIFFFLKIKNSFIGIIVKYYKLCKLYDISFNVFY